jgi:hypothetical protein
MEAGATSLTFSIISIVCGFLSSYYWYKSAKIKYKEPPRFNKGAPGSVHLNPTGYPPGAYVSGDPLVSAKDISAYITDSSKCNTIAAILSGLTMLSAALSMLATLL